mmetsp:Transcript_11206/g.39655  ORF Transcript_11206/g.39655 Transcript_11206/m.39655 type:complete len:200 (+) Transcript_11206:205-804(+)
MMSKSGACLAEQPLVEKATAIFVSSWLRNSSILKLDRKVTILHGSNCSLDGGGQPGVLRVCNRLSRDINHQPSDGKFLSRDASHRNASVAAHQRPPGRRDGPWGRAHEAGGPLRRRRRQFFLLRKAPVSAPDRPLLRAVEVSPLPGAASVGSAQLSFVARPCSSRVCPLRIASARSWNRTSAATASNNDGAAMPAFAKA